MSGHVDLDRLADFVGGALDGTPAEREVRDLVTHDPGWAGAYARLLAATDAVRADLRSFGAVAESVPSDVAARIEAALGAGHGWSTPAGRDWSPPGALGRPARAEPGRPAGGPVGLTRPPSPRTPGGPGRTRRRWVALLTAAASVVAVGLGIAVAVPRVMPGGEKSTASAPKQDDARADAGQASPGDRSAFGAQSGASASVPIVLASGRDYSVATLASLPELATSSPHRLSGTAGVAGDSANAAPKDAPQELGRLTDPATLNRCVAAIVDRYVGRVRLVDFARFEGQPAIVALLDPVPIEDNRPWVVVVGPTCGVDGTVGKILHAGPVGP